MNDKENYRELLGARLEAIHNAETSLKDFPSDEEILRWERLAAARLAERKAKKRKLISAAAVFLLAIAIGVAVIIGPPDVQAGGDGGAVIVDATEEGVKMVKFDSVENISNEITEDFLFIPNRISEMEYDLIEYKETEKYKQLKIIFIYKDNKIMVDQIIGEAETLIKHKLYQYEKKEKWEGKEVYISVDKSDSNRRNYSLLYDNIFVSIYCDKGNETVIKNLIEKE